MEMFRKIRKISVVIFSILVAFSMFICPNIKSLASDKALGDKQDIFSVLTYTGDEGIEYNINPSDDASGGNGIYGVWLAKEQVFTQRKDKLILKEKSPGLELASISILPKNEEGIYRLSLTVSKDYGEISEEAGQDISGGNILAMDNKGNKTWVPVEIKIKNQNAKGIPNPKGIEIKQFDKINDEQIFDAIKKGSYKYEEEVPPINKNLEVQKVNPNIGGKEYVLDETKFINFKIKEGYKLDTSVVKEHEVHVIVTYFDGSTDEVIVKVNVTSDVPTGILDRGYGIPALIIGISALLVGIIVIKLKRNAHIDYE